MDRGHRINARGWGGLVALLVLGSAPQEPFAALTFNRISINGLTTNGATPQASNSLELQADSLHETEEGREMLTHTARCALAEGQTLWTLSGHSYSGMLSLAPEWMQQPLTLPGPVTGCVLSLVNPYDISVAVSQRGPTLETTEQEREEYSVHEGAFFGNAFSESPARYSCYMDGAEQSPDAELRGCTLPGNECEIESLGPCEGVCVDFDEDIGWTRCIAFGEEYEPINTFLRAQ